MKKILLMLVVLAVIVLAGCGEKTSTVDQTSTVDDAQPAQTQQNTATQTKTEEQVQTGARPDLQALEKAGNDCMKKGLRVCLPVNFATASAGDKVGFAFGFSNIDPSTQKFVITVKFVETQQSMGELPIEPDKEYMARWFAGNDFKPYYELDYTGQISKPVIFDIKDSIGDGKKTVSGAYVFEIQVQTMENGFYENYGGAQKVTIRVK